MPLRAWECRWGRGNVWGPQIFWKVLCNFLVSVCFIHLNLLQWETHFLLFQRKLRKSCRVVFEH